jgi:hypothetical protein
MRFKQFYIIFMEIYQIFYLYAQIQSILNHFINYSYILRICICLKSKELWLWKNAIVY